MNIKRLFLLTLSLTAVLATVSCKKSEEETTYDSVFKTDPNFNVDAFVERGDRFLLVPTNPKRAEDDSVNLSVGIIWSTDIIKNGRSDTVRYEGEDITKNDGSYILIVPDTLTTMTIYCTAYADDYYNSEVSQYCTIVDESESLTNLGLDSTKTFVDKRDNTTYFYKKLGNTFWMAKNLAYAGTKSNVVGRAFGNCDVTNGIFGRFYTWEEAQTACPFGWRLPKQEDFNKLARIYDSSASYSPTESMPGLSGHFMSDAYFNGEKLWEYWPKVKIDNAFGTSMIPVGYAVRIGDEYDFLDANYRATMWTSDEFANRGVLKYIYADDPDLKCFAADKQAFAATVRCVRD